MSLPPDGMNWASDREWEGEPEYTDYTVCRPCREGGHDVCWGPNYKPRFPIDTGTHNIWIQGCRCNEEWTHPWHSPVKLIKDAPWICDFCKFGGCDKCVSKICDCEHRRQNNNGDSNISNSQS